MCLSDRALTGVGNPTRCSCKDALPAYTTCHTKQRSRNSRVSRRWPGSLGAHPGAPRTVGPRCCPMAILGHTTAHTKQPSIAILWSDWSTSTPDPDPCPTSCEHAIEIKHRARALGLGGPLHLE